MSTLPPPAANDSIQVFDKYGREFQVSREHWRHEVLPAALKSNWDNADALYGAILQALNDNLFEDVAFAAERLLELEPGSARSATALAFIRLRQRRIDEAQSLLEGYLSKHGPEGAVLNNLAKVHAERNEKDMVERTLWRSIEADPNNDNSVGWFEAIARERGGSTAATDALKRVAALPNAWRARMHLARYALDARDAQGAMSLYREALGMVGADVPTEVLMTITGDLGKRGFLVQLLEFGMPRYVPEAHGIMVGNNLIKAYLDSGKPVEARSLLERLYKLNRPDWKSALSFWDAQLMQAESSRNVQVGPIIEMAMYVIDGPVWAHAASPIAKIFPPPAGNAVRVAFVGATAEVPNAPATPQVQLADAAGRLSRILPLYLSEQAQFHCGARVRSLFPWMDNAQGGSFVLTTLPTPDADAIARAKGGGACDYVVVTHVKGARDPWSATMKLIRCFDGKVLFQHEAFATIDRTDIIGVELAIELQRALEKHAGTPAHLQSAYMPPAPPQLAHYMLRLEQLLAVRCARSPSALHGIREIIEGAMHLCLDLPKSVTMRALLADIVARVRNIRPDVADEFSERVRLLQEEHPLEEPAQSALASLFAAKPTGA
jgi:tetratricopeptide (TPR) repeat protein